MNGPDQAVLEELIRIAAQAAEVVMEVYSTPFAVDFKAPHDPVTEADRRANELICEALERAFPGVPVVAEESAPASFANFRESERVFFVDPVDGTRDFVEKNGQFAVMIGLLEGERAVAAVIDAPARAQAFAGWVGAGAFMIEGGKRSPVHVSTVQTIAEGRIVSSRSHRGPQLERALAQLAPGELVTLGSAGLKATVVANGWVEAYVAPGYAGKRWDACAADALVTAAGGRFSDAHGDPIAYRGPNLHNDRGLLATNGLVHDEVVSQLKLLFGD